MSDSTKQQRWVIFDADNTLWDVESLYNEARNEFCAHVMNLISVADGSTKMNGDMIEILQRHRDIQLHLTHGYSASRFTRSFEDTLLFLLPHVPAADIKKVREIASRVFLAKPKVTRNLEATLSALGTDFFLAIVTAGEPLVQERRIATFEFRNLFDEVLIVDKKTSQTFDEFCSSNNVDKENSWVVGDSLRSDVIPSTEVGLRAIHFDAPNWIVEHGERPVGVPVAQSMDDVLKLIRGA